MWIRSTTLIVIFVSSALLYGCGGASASSIGTPTPTTAAPTVSTTPAQSTAVIVSLASATAGATIYYTVDGSAPSATSQRYEAPFLVASNLTVKAIAAASGVNSTVTTQTFSPTRGVGSGGEGST